MLFIFAQLQHIKLPVSLLLFIKYAFVALDKFQLTIDSQLTFDQLCMCEIICRD